METMKIKDLPSHVKELALLNQEREGNKRDEEVLISNEPKDGGFSWDASPEGYDYWVLVASGKFEEAEKDYWGNRELKPTESEDGPSFSELMELIRKEDERIKSRHAKAVDLIKGLLSEIEANKDSMEFSSDIVGVAKKFVSDER